MTDQSGATPTVAAPKTSSGARTSQPKPPRRVRGSKAGTRPPKAKTASAKPVRGSGGTKSAGTKQAQLIAMLRRADGVTVEEVVKALGWQAHTVRGAIAGALKKKLGLKIESEKSGERGRVYRIAD